jgi:predicted acylesterase/phospholipase RssA
MAMTPLRRNAALAIDGGGIKGLIVAKALIALEDELGGRPLIEHPSLKILAGTSTGAIITAAIAVGMSAREITDLYVAAGSSVFPALLPAWVPPPLPQMWALVLRLVKSALYTGASLQQQLRDAFQRTTGNPDVTFGELRKRLREDQALIITAVDINERRTRFLKSYDDADADWPLWQAVMASSAAPTLLPVQVRKRSDGTDCYFTDGGVGSFGNPGYVAAREIVEWQGCDPQDVTVLSLGTGWVNAKNFERANGKPSSWRIIQWAMNAIVLMLGDAARAQSFDIMHDYMQAHSSLDFRRFQIEMEDDISMDDASAATMQRLGDYGQQMGQRILKDQHALGTDPGFDPEGLRGAIQRVEASMARREMQLSTAEPPAEPFSPRDRTDRVPDSGD